MLKMSKNHSTRLKVSNFSLENWNEVLNEQSTKFFEWNQSDIHATQLIKVIHSISRFIVDEYLIGESASIKNIWKKTYLDLEILVEMMWVDVGFRIENPHQVGLGFSGSGGFGVGFTVGFWWVLTKTTLKKILILLIVLLKKRGI
jgi:hypothetical protein